MSAGWVFWSGRLGAAAILFLGCGNDASVADGPIGDAPVDASPDALPSGCESRDAGVNVGPLVELPFIATSDGGCDLNTAYEPSVAVSAGNVVIAHIDIGLVGDGTTFCDKRVSLSISHDSGQSFAEPIEVPNQISPATDPVLLADQAGRIWFSRLVGASQTCSVSASLDDALTWTSVVDGLPCQDKEWIAVDNGTASVYVASAGGFWKYSLNGTMLAQAAGTKQVANGYVDTTGAHFALIEGSQPTQDTEAIVRWNGAAQPAPEGMALPLGADENLFNQTGVAIGETLDGGQWIVRTVRVGAESSLVLRVRHLPSDEGTDIPIGSPNEVAFLPAAAMDSRGRLHVVWYDSACTTGVLKYAHSLTSSLIDGFTLPTIIDGNASPGMGWFPFYSTPQGGRRLREYISIALDAGSAYIAWTHAPVLPSRVWTTYVTF